MKQPLNVFFLVDKPAAWTSFDVCAKLRKPLNIKRIGHTGTLDPFATGLLVVAVGKCTKLIPFFEKDIKIYRTKILLGKTSETLDPESEIIDVPIQDEEMREFKDERDLEAFLQKNFLGKIEQVPPKYSALKIDGKRAYDLARKGALVEMKSRPTEVFDIKVLNYNFPELEVELTVAAGFYVRSFARDVGTALAGAGMCKELRRLGVGEISIKEKAGAEIKTLTETALKSGNFEVGDYALDPQSLIRNIVHINVPSGRLPDLQAGRAMKIKNDELRIKNCSIDSPTAGGSWRGAVSEDLPNGEKLLLICEGKTVGVGEIISGNVQPRVVF